MHCDRCNIDFSEGLRYCKWCGGSLVDRARVTSELHSCPSCSAAVQQSWAFCKTCGERLRVIARGPAVCPRCGASNDPGATRCLSCGADLAGARAAGRTREPVDTSVIAACSSCGERLDTGSLYCKACGSAVYTDQKPFGGSALLCAACNSYSPVGSRVCRVCGAGLTSAPQTVVDRAAPAPPVRQEPSTPDSDRHVVTGEMGTAGDEQPIIDSGAHTVAFVTPERASTSRPRKAIETSGLPGTAGSKSEQQAPTSVVQMGRITGSVEGEAAEAKSGEPEEAAASQVEGSPAIRDEQEASETTAESAAPQAAMPEAMTSGFGSESTISGAGTSEATQVIVSPVHEIPPSPQFSNFRTGEFTSAQDERYASSEFQPPAALATADRVKATSHMGGFTEEQAGTDVFGGGATGDFAPAASLDVQPASQPLPNRRPVILGSLVVAAIVIIAAGYVAWWLMFARSRPAPQPSRPSDTSETAAQPSAAKAPTVPEGMVPVAAGTYTLGRNNADPLERPQHNVDLPGFYIDRTEVTNGAYKKFVDATGRKPPTNWSGGSYPEGRENFPVTGITWDDAAAYAEWAGKRLPTEAEWEAAARGADARLYPWGNEWSEGVANIGLKADDVSNDQYPSGLAEVGRYPKGASPAGAVDMIGNAWEWTADEFALYSGGIKAIPKDIKDKMKPGLTYRIIRGGAYDGNKQHDATYRGLLDAGESFPKVGFRCAKDAK